MVKAMVALAHRLEIIAAIEIADKSVASVATRLVLRSRAVGGAQRRAVACALGVAGVGGREVTERDRDALTRAIEMANTLDPAAGGRGDADVADVGGRRRICRLSLPDAVAAFATLAMPAV